MKLKLGDKIYFFQHGKYPTGFETIIKITPTQFKTKNYNLKLDGDYIRIVGAGIWNITTLQKENETNKSLWLEYKMINWTDSQKFTDEQKIKIYNLFNQPAGEVGEINN